MQMIIIDNNTIFSIIKKNLNKEKVMERKTLKRQLGVLDVTAITAGIVIGAGVFVVLWGSAQYTSTSCTRLKEEKATYIQRE